MVKSETYPAPSVRQEPVVLGPVAGVYIKQSSGHDENPHAQVDGVQQVIEK